MNKLIAAGFILVAGLIAVDRLIIRVPDTIAVIVLVPALGFFLAGMIKERRKEKE